MDKPAFVVPKDAVGLKPLPRAPKPSPLLQPAIRPLNLGVDVAFVVAVAALVIIGMLMVYSASWPYSLYVSGSPGYMLSRQILWASIGTVAAIFLSRFDYHHYQKLALPLMAATSILLIAVLVIGDVRYNSTRTIFNGSIQPSELAKFVIVIYLAVWLYSKQDQLRSVWLGLIPLILILGLTSALIFFQPDLSATATIIILGGLLFYLAGGDLRQILLIMVVSLIVGAILFYITETGKARISSYIAGLIEPENTSYHIKRALEAIIRGDIFGVGIGQGKTKFTGLPVAWTDSIFAVIVEETGIFGAGIVICLYMVFLWRGLFIARQAPDTLGYLLASGMTIWVIFEAVLNMGVIVNLLPFAGNALPLISAGGSSLVTTLAGIGVILSVSYTTNKTKNSTTKGRMPGAVVNMRGRDWRRGVSRNGYPANTEK